ncbi:hypothetical protein [Sinimarinibacterium sp. NLF-5-8]|uniref:hypothetical protein n=1 Tax=Sinimarinibacterium sp. NLF-5-8 TaxID=2698684 RepID=UPI00137BC4C3|nr:hypothetical protein [Sinimarinibacterium sp. NLF-5-8]QHS09040.1 hypothetical protein GT972_02030 [Sinimarinibacterium sp. NLF-5-8]
MNRNHIPRQPDSCSVSPTEGIWEATPPAPDCDAPRIFCGSRLIGFASNSDMPRDEKEANARLMAAAPELLRALVQLLAEAENLRESYSDAREFDGWDAVEEEPCFALAREAIAKALPPNAELRRAADEI